MTIQEIEWFANHKYGECVYLIPSDDELLILTMKSKWRIILKDRKRFGTYTLFHLNHATDRQYYHKQCNSVNLEWLVYYAIRHDLDIPADYQEFNRLYEMWKLGRQIEESIAAFNFFCEEY